VQQRIMNNSFIRELKHIVGGRHVSTGPADMALYAYDASLAGGRPDVIVFPADEKETAAVVRCAHRAAVPLVARGFGTNLSGGTVMPGGGLVVGLSRLNRICGIYPERRCAVVQPSVTNLELQNALAPHGFFYAPDPASQKVATLGGNIGENAGGPRCLKYGVTTNHILGVRCVLADGGIVHLGGEALDPAGLDMRGVVIGSEGTLAVVTEATVRILPLAEKVACLLAVYDDILDAARSVSRIIMAGILPTTLEMMDAPVIKAVEANYACGYPHDAAAVLIIEVEGPAAALGPQAGAIQDICMHNGCRTIRQAKDEAERSRLWEGRRGAFGAVARLAPNFLVNDCTVPRTRLPEALAAVEQIAAAYGMPHGNVFHAGDGNLHPLLFFDARDEHQLKQVKQAGWEIMKACVELGGTISGEHGIGLEKRAAMHLMFSENDLSFQRALKPAFDPDQCLNPGKAIPPAVTDPAQAPSYRRIGEDACDAEKAIVTAVQKALAEKRSLQPLGCGSRRAYGNRCPEPSTPLDSAALTDMFAYDPDNQVVTAGAGMTLEQVQQTLRVRGQWLPLRPPPGAGAHSLGGITALGISGPERLLYGAPRDLVLGLRLVDGRGRIISTGGRVVKNVAGYDMTRLMVGSAGTLGFFTRVTLRTAVIPERCTAVLGHGRPADCRRTVHTLLTHPMGPVFITAFAGTHQGRLDEHRPWQLVVGFEGLPATVDDQLENTRRRMTTDGLQDVACRDYDVLEGCFADHCAALERHPFILRVQAPTDRLTILLSVVTGLAGVDPLLLDLGTGAARLGLAHLDDEDWRRFCAHALDNKSHLVLEKAPEDFKRHNDVFGTPRPEWPLMHRIKAALDPCGVFAPARLPGR